MRNALHLGTQSWEIGGARRFGIRGAISRAIHIAPRISAMRLRRTLAMTRAVLLLSFVSLASPVVPCTVADVTNAAVRGLAVGMVAGAVVGIAAAPASPIAAPLAGAAIASIVAVAHLAEICTVPEALEAINGI